MSGRWDGRGREGVVLLLCLHLLALAQFWGTQHHKSLFFWRSLLFIVRSLMQEGFFTLLHTGQAVAGRCWFPFGDTSATTPRASPCTHAPFWGNPG